MSADSFFRMINVQQLRAIPVVSVLVLALFGCSDATDPVVPIAEVSAPSILALGDSYTVGHSLPMAWSWPAQLADSLVVMGDSLVTARVIARTGWTTRDLLEALRDSLASGDQAPQYGVVTVMIGVNNQFQGGSIDVFAAELDTLLMMAVELAGQDSQRVLGFSIPDYGLTPIGSLYGAERIAAEIDAFNGVLASKLAKHGVMYLDVTAMSRMVASEPDLVSRDGLHYAPEMYRRWVTMMLPAVRQCLSLAKNPNAIQEINQ